jgi:hypothetical protein
VRELAQRRFIPLEARPNHARRPVAAAVDFIGRCGAEASRNSAAAHSSNPFPANVESFSDQLMCIGPEHKS